MKYLFNMNSNQDKLRTLIRESFNQSLLNEYVSAVELMSLEQYLDKFFDSIGIGIEFTDHFRNRINDFRNKKEIEIDEIRDLFVKTYKKWGERIAKLKPETEAVITDMNSDLNVPFVVVWDNDSREFDLVSKTVMRKRNFETSNPRLKV